jgi:hypothetical protein
MDAALLSFVSVDKARFESWRCRRIAIEKDYFVWPDFLDLATKSIAAKKEWKIQG